MKEENLNNFVICFIISFSIILINTVISYGITFLFSKLKIGEPFYVFFISNIILNGLSFTLVISALYSSYEEISKKYKEEFGDVGI